MAETPSAYHLIYQLRAFFARNPNKSFSVPELRRKFGEAVQFPLLSLSHEGYLNTVQKYGMPYYDIIYSNERLIICPALGHLYSIDARPKSKANSYPVWDFEWKPRHLIERGQKKIEYWVKAISELSKQAEKFVNG